jgi:hypothetical protein
MKRREVGGLWLDTSLKGKIAFFPYYTKARVHPGGTEVFRLLENLNNSLKLNAIRLFPINRTCPCAYMFEVG